MESDGPDLGCDDTWRIQDDRTPMKRDAMTAVQNDTSSQNNAIAAYENDQEPNIDGDKNSDKSTGAGNARFTRGNEQKPHLQAWQRQSRFDNWKASRTQAAYDAEHLTHYPPVIT